MAKEGRPPSFGLDAMAAAARTAGGRGPPPVDQWNPPYCGEIDMRIGGDGTWYYQKSPIGRPALVKLFASILKREDDRYYLVTPVEKCGIVVDDAPFLAVELKIEHSAATDPRKQSTFLRFRTNVDDWIECGQDHPIHFEVETETGGLKPYLHVRRNLWAKVTRAIYYDLVDLGEERQVDGVGMFGICSHDQFFPMAPADSLKGLS